MSVKSLKIRGVIDSLRRVKKTVRVCREVSVKEITADCERTTLYKEENCGQPTSYVVCEEVRLK